MEEGRNKIHSESKGQYSKRKDRFAKESKENLVNKIKNIQDIRAAEKISELEDRAEETT